MAGATVARVRQLVEGQPQPDTSAWLALAIDATHIDGNADLLRIAATAQDRTVALTAIANMRQAVANAGRRLP